MPAHVSTPHCPFDRLWQPGHPFRARRSRCRRWTMALLLIFMSGVISSYWYLTDPTRVRQMCQSYLSELVGGRVEVGSASLSILQGLKLSNITVKVDQEGPADDTTVFHADDVEIQYNPASLLRGQLQATRIIATGAQAKLVENAAAGRWNYQRLVHSANKRSVTQPVQKPPLALPELILRDAQVQYSEIQETRCVPRGSMDIEGRFFPSDNATLYSFELQSRGQSEGVGPVVSGTVALKSGQVVAALSHLRFGPDVEAMLPHEVRDFWLAHKVQGALDIPEFRYTPPTARHKVSFSLRTQPQHVHLVIRAEELDPPPQFDLPFTRAGTKLWAPLEELSAAVREFRRTLYWMHGLPEHPALAVDDVSGEFYFDENGIRIEGVTGTLAGATLAVNGRIDGYSPDAPIRLRVESKPGQLINIPEHPDFLAALPGPLHQAYSMLKPYGTGTMWAELNRPTVTSSPEVTGEIDIVDGNFDCIFFPYPIHKAAGKVIFAPDPSGTFEKVTMEDLHGYGLPDGPNANVQLWLGGWVGAMNPDVGCRIRAWATNATSEPALFTAFPPPVRQVMDIFKGPGNEKYPHFLGDFDCTVFVPPGVEMRPIVSVDLKLKDGAGKLTAFPYPLQNMKGTVNVRDGYVDLNDVEFSHGPTTVTVGGRVTWPVDLPRGAEIIAKPDVTVRAKNVPIDAALCNALPPDAARWLGALGVKGMLDVDGKVLPKPNPTSAADSIAFDMNLALHDGAAKPRGSDFQITDVTGKLVAHADRLQVLELHGKRGDSTLDAGGTVNWSTGAADVNIDASATHLQLEPALREMLPPDAAAAWKALDPHGIIDSRVVYHGIWPVTHSEPVASIQPQVDSLQSPALPVSNQFNITLKPVDVSATPAALPYRLDHCAGEIAITPDSIVITDLHGVHGKARIDISGRGITTNPNDWDFTLRAQNLPADKELLTALPLQMRQVLDELKYQGNLSVDLTTFRYRGDKPDPDIDFAGTLSASNGSVDVGMPVDKIDGSMPFSAAVRNGKLLAFRGDLDLNQLNLAGRPVTDFKATLDLPNGSDVLHVGAIRGTITDGEVAGDMDLNFPEVGPSTYSMDFAVKNVDLREMAKQVGPKGQVIRGQMSASLALQGEWANPATRRGRGDVIINGKEMYQIPLLLGLLEVTNLSLPTTSPFNEGTARYLVEGNRVTFEQLQMRSNDMVMSGNGWLDFGSKQVRMNFTTENPNLPQVPLISDLLNGAKQELLQIQVRGTVQSPTVSTSSFHTFTTTVDQVLNGSDKDK